jgi:hypothetical protein
MTKGRHRSSTELGTTSAVGPEAEFQFVNIARWRSAEDFAAAIGSTAFRESAAGLAGYRPHPGLYRTVRS